MLIILNLNFLLAFFQTHKSVNLIAGTLSMYMVASSLTHGSFSKWKHLESSILNVDSVVSAKLDIENSACILKKEERTTNSLAFKTETPDENLPLLCYSHGSSVSGPNEFYRILYLNHLTFEVSLNLL